MSLRPGPPSRPDDAWARSQLGPGEQALWARMSNPDRRHALAVAREVARRWPEVDRDGPTPTPVLAAALLHDVGKVESGLRTPARVGATVVWAVLDDDLAARWADDETVGRMRRRLGRYRRHPEIGADLLRRAGADPLTADWAEHHHRPEGMWSVDLAVGRLLKACDDD